MNTHQPHRTNLNPGLAKKAFGLLFAALIAFAPAARGDITQVGFVPGLGPIMRAQVDASAFSQNYRRQMMSQWCWAASIANIFAFHGHPVSQEEIVRTVYGRIANLPAFTGSVIAQQVNRTWTDDNGKRFRARLTAAYDFDAGVIAINNNFMINELRHERPFLFGNRSHCMVVTAIDFAPSNVINVGVFDPWPSASPARQLSPAEIVPMNRGGQMRFLATVTVTDLP